MVLAKMIGKIEAFTLCAFPDAVSKITVLTSRKRKKFNEKKINKYKMPIRINFK